MDEIFGTTTSVEIDQVVKTEVTNMPKISVDEGALLSKIISSKEAPITVNVDDEQSLVLKIALQLYSYCDFEKVKNVQDYARVCLSRALDFATVYKGFKNKEAAGTPIELNFDENTITLNTSYRPSQYEIEIKYGEGSSEFLKNATITKKADKTIVISGIPKNTGSTETMAQVILFKGSGDEKEVLQAYSITQLTEADSVPKEDEPSDGSNDDNSGENNNPDDNNPEGNPDSGSGDDNQGSGSGDDNNQDSGSDDNSGDDNSDDDNNQGNGDNNNPDEPGTLPDDSDDDNHIGGGPVEIPEHYFDSYWEGMSPEEQLDGKLEYCKNGSYRPQYMALINNKADIQLFAVPTYSFVVLQIHKLDYTWEELHRDDKDKVYLMIEMNHPKGKNSKNKQCYPKCCWTCKSIEITEDMVNSIHNGDKPIFFIDFNPPRRIHRTYKKKKVNNDWNYEVEIRPTLRNERQGWKPHHIDDSKTPEVVNTFLWTKAVFNDTNINYSDRQYTYNDYCSGY